MYRCFNLRIPPDSQILNKLGHGTRKYQEALSSGMKNVFVEQINNDNAIDGIEMQGNWFRNIDCDIFISHAHIDRDKALSLAEWLHTRFGLIAFVDSMIWGCVRDLQLILDKKYNDNGLINGIQNYDYHASNNAASHVHMMLATSIMMMIDRTECVFLLNTPESIKASDTINHTQSPWIYYEILVSNLIRNKRPKRKEAVSEGNMKVAKSLTKAALIINYESDLSLFTEIGSQDLLSWSEEDIRNQHPLDVLYSRHPLNKILLEST